MKRETEVRLELFAENARTIKKGITTTTGMDRRTAALIYAVKGKKMDRGKIEDCYAMLKKGAGILSPFRESTPLCNAALISLEKNPQEALDRALAVYDMLKEVKFRSSPYLASAAIQIASAMQPVDYRSTVSRMRSFYDAMKAKSWLHTGADDYILAAMFAISGAIERSSVERIEKVYQRLSTEFKGKGSVLALAQVLALGWKTDEATVQRVIGLRDVLKKRRMSLARPFAVPILGILSQIDLPVDTIVQEARDVEIFLKAQTGEKSLGLSKVEIHMVATAMVATTFSKNMGSGLVTASVLTSMTNLIIATQVAFIVIVAAASAGVTAIAASST
jgi:hypothetical protein